MAGAHGRSAGSGVRVVAELAGLTVLAFVVALVAGIVFVVPMLALGYGIETNVVLVGATAASQLGMLALGYGYYRYRDVSISLRFPSLRAIGVAVVGVVLALVAAIGLSVVLTVLDLVPESVIGETGTSNPSFFLGLAVLSIVLVAPVEEFLFRGVVQGRLRERFGPVPAIAGASLLFGSMHLANYAGALLPIVAGALLIAIVGAIFGTLYELTDNLAVPIAVHGVYNAILLLVSYVATTAV